MLAGRSLEAVGSVLAAPSDLLCPSGRPEDDDRVAVRVVDDETEQTIDWGTASVVGLLLASAPPHEIVIVRKSDCTPLPSPPPPSLPIACITYKAPPARGPPLSSFLPRRLLSLDEMEAALAQRLAQYRQPTRACLPTTDEEVRLDRMGYVLACAAMARNAHNDRLLSNAAHRGSTAWRHGEYAIACFRLAQPGAAESLVPGILSTGEGRVKSAALQRYEREREQLRHALKLAKQERKAGRVGADAAVASARAALQAAGEETNTAAASHLSSLAMFGVDALRFPELLLVPHAHGAYARLERGKVYARTPLLAMAAAKVLDGINQFNLHQGAQPEQLAQHEGIAELMDAFHHEVRALTVRHPDRLADGARRRTAYDRFAPPKYVAPVVDVDDLVRVMPMCMRIQAERAFHPDDAEARLKTTDDTDKTQTRHHLHFADRSIFFRFVLANGMHPEVFDAAVTAPWEGDAKYQEELRREIKGTAKFIATHGSTSDYNGDSCKKLQLDGYCPFFNDNGGDAGKARIACYHNQGAMLMRPDNPPGWSIGFPLVFSQQVKRALLLARDDAAPSPSA